MGDMKRVKPLVNLTTIWDKDSVSEYADEVRIPMEDGHVITYRQVVDQPHPAFQRVMNILKRPKGCYWHEKGRNL